VTSKRPDLRLLPDPEFPLLGGADDWIYNAAAAPGADDWEPMADGYHQAAEIVAEHLAERPGFRGYLTSPLLFLCRHSLELRIKGIIANSADLLDTPVDLICPATQSPGRLSWAPPVVVGFGIKIKYVLRRRPSNRKWRAGSANGEFRIGFSMTTGGTSPPQDRSGVGASCRIPGGRVRLDGTGAARCGHRGWRRR
jgi:hypothetical protein